MRDPSIEAQGGNRVLLAPADRPGVRMRHRWATVRTEIAPGFKSSPRPEAGVRSALSGSGRTILVRRIGLHAILGEEGNVGGAVERLPTATRCPRVAVAGDVAGSSRLPPRRVRRASLPSRRRCPSAAGTKQDSVQRSGCPERAPGPTTDHLAASRLAAAAAPPRRSH